MRSLITRAAPPRTLSPAPSPSGRVNGWSLGTGYPPINASRPTSRVSTKSLGLEMTTGKMRLTDFCNRLTTRAPTTPSESRWRPQGTLTRPLGLPRLPCLDTLRSPPERAWEPAWSAEGSLPTNRRVELRLTANLQLRPVHSLRALRRDLSHEAGSQGTARSWERLDRRHLRAMPPDDGVLHRAERAAELLTPSVATAPPARPFDRAARTATRPSLRRGLVKDHAVPMVRTPSDDGYPLLHTGTCRRELTAFRLLPRADRLQPKAHASVAPSALRDGRFQLSRASDDAVGSTRIRHRTRDFAAARRLRAPLSPSR